MRSKRSLFTRFTRIAVALVCCLALAACGSGGGNTKTNPITGENGNKKEESAGKFEKGSSMETIQQRGKLIVGVPTDLPPFVSNNPSTGSIEGFDVDIARLMASGIFGAQLEGKVEFVEIDSRDRELMLEQKRIDIALGRYEVTVPRKRFVDFAGPYFAARQVAVFDRTNRSQERIQRVSDLAGRKLCTVRGSTNIAEVAKVLPTSDISMVKSTVSECGAELAAGSVAAVVADHTDLLSLTKQDGSRYQRLELNTPVAPYGIGVSKERTDLRSYLNDRLALVEKDRRWQDSYERWIDDDDQPPSIERY